MENQPPDKSYDFAQQVCRDLRAGVPESLLVLYNRYHQVFAVFTKRRLFDADPHYVEEVLSNFWIELLNGRAICKFKGKSSLQTYLTVILNRRIIDANRKFDRDRNSRMVIQKRFGETAPEFQSIPSPEDELMGKEQQRLIVEALVQLEATSPRDANLIRMHLEGLTYEEMAKRELKDDNYDSQQLKKKIDAVKKQFTRDHTGSLAKFKSILNPGFRSE